MLLFQVGEAPPAIATQPADRLGHEGREHVEEIVVADGVVAVDAVHALDHRRTGLAVDPVAEQLGHHQTGVVVALARPLGELTGAIQQSRD